ncbi:hypothetical protein [Rhizobium leguminosarum]
MNEIVGCRSLFCTSDTNDVFCVSVAILKCAALIVYRLTGVCSVPTNFVDPDVIDRAAVALVKGTEDIAPLFRELFELVDRDDDVDAPFSLFQRFAITPAYFAVMVAALHRGMPKTDVDMFTALVTERAQELLAAPWKVPELLRFGVSETDAAAVKFIFETPLWPSNDMIAYFNHEGLSTVEVVRDTPEYILDLACSNKEGPSVPYSTRLKMKAFAYNILHDLQVLYEDCKNQVFR